MKNNFLVKINKNIYCGECGELLFDDYREIKKHEKKCFIHLNSTPSKLENILAYTLEAKNEKLILIIFKALDDTKNFKGIEWQEIYRCYFYKNNTYKEEGEENLFFWRDMLENNFLIDGIIDDTYLNLSPEPLFITINKIFTGVGYVKTLADFINRFLIKGFKNKVIEKTIIRKIKPIKLDINTILAEKISGYFNFCQLKEEVIDNEVIFSCCCISAFIKNKNIEILNKNMIYISKNYIYNPYEFNISEFLKNKIYFGRFRYDNFTKKYPELKLKEYMESGGNNPLQFLLSENNDFLIELTGKAKLGYLCNAANSLREINRQGKNVKEIYGLPIKALRCINNKEICEILDDTGLKTLQKAYKIQPALFTSTITKNELAFLKAKLSATGRSITSSKDTPKDILEYARYCKELNDEEYDLFVDYSNMCNSQNLWPYKKFPEKSDIRIAHDVIMNYMNEKRRAYESKSFEEALCEQNYLNLIDLPHNDFYEKSKFTMLMPRKADDLVEESYQMRNCVRSYINAVSSRRTYILFLRIKKSKSKSFVTVEISTNYELIQVKAKCNAHPNEETREWMKQYCTDKGINYSDCWDMKDKGHYWY